MDASASLALQRNPSGVARMFMVALLAAAFLLGGMGGYLVRGLSAPASTTPTNTTTHPFVTAPIPYSSPTYTPAAQPSFMPY